MRMGSIFGSIVSIFNLFGICREIDGGLVRLNRTE